jgi:hypothetical protein
MAKGWLALATILAVASSTPGAAQTDAAVAPASATAADEASRIAEAAHRGALIYRYDQAAWHSSDALVADLTQAELAAVRGWVVVPAGDALRTIYYAGEPGAHTALYSADWSSGDRTSNRRRYTTPDDQRLDAETARVIALRDSISFDGLQNCSNRAFNIVTLPASATGNSDSIYLLSPQTDRNIPFGGHHRIDFVDGRETARRRFTNSCIAFPPQGDMLFISHLLDPIPTEIHVFSMYAARRAVAVGTADQRIWAVEPGSTGPRISLIDPSRR